MGRDEPVTTEKHGRPVAVVLSVEAYESLKNLERSRAGIISNEAEHIE